MIFLAVIAVAALALLVVWGFARRGYGEAETPGRGWHPTPEVSVDPTTGRRMRVWIDERGARRYVPEVEQGPGPT